MLAYLCVNMLEAARQLGWFRQFEAAIEILATHGYYGYACKYIQSNGYAAFRQKIFFFCFSSLQTIQRRLNGNG